MRLSAVPVLAALSCLARTSIAIPDDAAQLASLLGQASNDILAGLQAEEDALAKRGIAATCTVKNIAVRQEL